MCGYKDNLKRFRYVFSLKKGYGQNKAWQKTGFPKYLQQKYSKKSTSITKLQLSNLKLVVIGSKLIYVYT